VGLAARRDRGERLGHRGLGSISPQQGTDLLEQVLRLSVPQIAVMPFQVRQWTQFYPRAASLPLLERLQAAAEDAPQKAATQESTSWKQVLLKAPVGERQTLLESHIKKQVGLVLGLDPARVDPRIPFGKMGMDSLMAIEFRNRLETSLGVTLSATLIWAHPTVPAAAKHLGEKLGLAADEQASAPKTEKIPDDQALIALLSRVSNLAQDETA
jgi:acyl carrier protein